MKGAASVVGLIATAALVACGIVALGATEDRLRGEPSVLLSKRSRQASLAQHQILTVAHQLESFSVPKHVSLLASKALSEFEQLCGDPHVAAAESGMTKSQMERIRQRADSNWWGVIKAFKSADEVQSAVLADPHHVHLIIYVAPGWCHFSQMQIEDMQKNFDNLGESKDRIHFIDVDDPKNERLVEFQGVRSYPTIVAVEGNYVLGKSEGYKAFDVVNKMAYADEDGKVFDATFPTGGR